MKWYQYNIRELTAAEYQKWYALMSGSQQERVNRFRFEDDKKRTVAGQMLAKNAIAAWCKVPAESVVLAESETGKPYAVDLPVEFNISHSGELVVCAVDAQPVGIDVEMIRPIHLRIAKRVCTEAELVYLFGRTPSEEDFADTTDPETLARFYELWTQKEAYCKLKGTGLSGLCAANDGETVKTEQIVTDGYVICVVCK